MAAAAATGTSIPAQTGVAPASVARAADATSAQASAPSAAGPTGRAGSVFDYTHLGRDGADYFAKMVTEELAVQVPTLREYLVP